ncbi:ribosome small subunit-dependent GTPase A [Paenarthrobacter sp. Z7-10]|nr:ribosome small subunit-dependent GTPase A [Paenarthrobacter sp. Z7-10]MCZ2403285.1 ribosome small subunit-dependent GTPase A [Paenarthrobacter sp. Z7-10]
MNGPVAYGFSPRIAELFTRCRPSGVGVQPARVVRADRNQVLLATANRHLRVGYPEEQLQCATGDWVCLGLNGHMEPAVLAVLPRYSQLARKRAFDKSTQAQVLAANMDLVGVVVPIDRPFSHNRLERTLVAAWNSGATPLVILTKADLANGHDDVVGQVIEQAAGVEVITTSAEQGDGLDELMLRLGAGTTLVLLGPSGAGKSTLINALACAQLQDTGSVRAADGRGKHTTTARELVPLPGGSVLMDTPGIRGLALWDAEAGMDAVFGDVEELFAECRFNDCGHGSEPGCAVQAAMEEGLLEPRRWHSYLKMQRELAHLHIRQNVAERRKDARSFAKSVKADAEFRGKLHKSRR